jgi:tetratricopeptide (TPR) repeat protein
MSVELENHLKNGTQLLFELHDAARALDEFSRALALDPQCLVAFVYRHFCYRELETWDRALSDLNQALRLCPDDHRLYTYRSEVNIELRDYPAAYDDLCEAMQLDGALELLWSRGFVALEMRRFAQAIEDYTEVILMCPQDACAHNNRGLAYMKNGQFEEALADFNTSLSINADHPDHHNSRARLYMMLGETDLARADSEAALDACERAFDPTLGDHIVWNDRAEALVRLGRFEEAIETSRSVVGIKPGDPEPYRFMAEAHCGLGNYDEALSFFEKSIALDADPEVIKKRDQLLEKIKSSTAPKSG